MDRGAVESFVTRSRSVLSNSSDMGVRNTQLRLVEPFLSLLDWDVRSGDVEAAFEAVNGTLIDYALLAGSTPGVFVTVEPAADPVSADGRRALLNAMRASHVPRGILTNGRTFVLAAYGPNPTSRTSNGENERSIADDFETVQLELDALPQNLSALEAVSYETAQQLSGSDRQRAAERLVVADEEAIDAVTETVIKICKEDVARDVEPLVRRFLEAVVDDLAPNLDPAELEPQARGGADAGHQDTVEGGSRSEMGSRGESAGDTNPNGLGREEPAARRAAGGSQTIASPGTPGDPATVAGEPDPAESEHGEMQSDDESASEEADTEYVVRFFEDGRSVAAVGNPSVDSAMAQAVEYLLRERGLGHRLQFPYAPGDDETAYLHRTPEHPDGREMRSWTDLDELALYTGQETSVKQERVRTLAERVGLQVMFSGDWP